MHITELQDLRKAVEPIIKEAGMKLRGSYGNVAYDLKAHEESTGAVVTQLDRETEKFLYEEFKKIDPSIGFRGEEFGTAADASMTWLVDPIDGTSHFIRGMPFCTMMVALVDNHAVVMSFIYHFVGGDMYWAIAGHGAYCNDERLRVSKRTLKEGMISFESKLTENNNLDLYTRLRAQTNDLKVISSGWEMSMVAAGKTEGRIAKDPYAMDWDCAPGSLLIREAGGVVTNLGKTTYDYRDHDYVMVNPVVYEELVTEPSALFPLT